MLGNVANAHRCSWDMNEAIRQPRRNGLRALAGVWVCAPVYADSADDASGFNAAALLVVLGVWAILMGVRNLRAMRYKPMVPHQRRAPSEARAEIDDD